MLIKGRVTDTRKYDFPRNLKISISLYQLRKQSCIFCAVYKPLFSTCAEMPKIMLSSWLRFHLGSCYDLKYFTDKLPFTLKSMSSSFK